MSMPMICWAARRASSAEPASLMPPALPRPPTGTCALTATGPSLANAAAASSGLRATTPGGIAMPSEARTSLAWYSRSFTLRRRVEGAGQVRVPVRVAVAEPALKVGAVEHEDGQADPEQKHDDQREPAADQHRGHRRNPPALPRLRAYRPPRVAVPVLEPVLRDPAALRVLPWHGLSIASSGVMPCHLGLACRALRMAIRSARMRADRGRRGS